MDAKRRRDDARRLEDEAERKARGGPRLSRPDGLIEPTPAEIRKKRQQIPTTETMTVIATDEGLRALSKATPISPASVEGYLESKFGEALADVRAAMTALARSLPPAQLARRAYGLYEQFRPKIPGGRAGWGAAGDLDLDVIRALARPEEGTTGRE